MLVLWFSVICNIVFLAPETTALPHYHQNDYDVKIERVELVWYNQSYARDVHLTNSWYNRSQKAFNLTGHLLVDLDGTDLVAEMQMLKFTSNEYRFFPLTVAGNVCHEYGQNNFNAKEILRNISNVHGCPFKKGFYYVYNFVAEYALLPPYIPRGRFKAVGKLYYNKMFVGEAHTYTEVKDKPLKWN